MDFTPIFSDYDNLPVPAINVLQNIGKFLMRLDINAESFNKAKVSSLKILKMHLRDLDLVINDMGDQAASSALLPFQTETRRMINEIEEINEAHDITKIKYPRALFMLVGEWTRYLKETSGNNYQKIVDFLKLYKIILP